jgi:hypothetical protein
VERAKLFSRRETFSEPEKTFKATSGFLDEIGVEFESTRLSDHDDSRSPE